MNLLFIGDIFASPGRRIVADHLQDIVETNGIDLAIANAENAAGGFGVTPAIAEELFALGLDVLTSGNHIWDKREVYDYFARQRVDCFSRAQRCRLRGFELARAYVYAEYRLPVPQSR